MAAEQDVGITPRSKSRQNRSRLGMASESPTRNDSKLDDEEGVATAVTDLLATNQKLRKNLKLKDAELLAVRTDLERAQEEILALRKAANAQAEEMMGMRRALEKAKLKRKSDGKAAADGGAGGSGRADGGGGGDASRRKHLPLSSERNEVDPTTGAVRRTRMNRQASIATSEVLDTLPSYQADLLAQKFIEIYKDPVAMVTYLSSNEFAQDILKLAGKAKAVFEAEQRCLFLESPIYVFGDTHGNLEDLHFFSDNIWKLGINLSAGRFLFLGDYVDRGMSSLEVVTYLMALKILYPTKIFMLRGNHETRDVNGWEEHYEERSFIRQCKDRFGEDMGELVWEELNQVFDRLPLSAIIDRDIFCIHGGIPRPIPDAPPNANRIEMIQRISPVSGINPPYEHEDEPYRQMASECIWSDPAGEDQEESGELGADGFGESPRGGGTVCFGNKALDDFLGQHQLSYIIRAHEAHAYGVSLSKRARCFTVFSTSKDHNQGSKAICGCILVDFDQMEVITRSPHYRNHYVHRRDSMSITDLPERELAQREKVGLVIEGEPSSDEEYEEYEEYEDEPMET